MRRMEVRHNAAGRATEVAGRTAAFVNIQRAMIVRRDKLSKLNASANLRMAVGLVLWAFAPAAHAEEPPTFDAALAPFFKTYCLRCHNAEKQEGEFRLDTLPRDFANESMAQR